MECLIGFCSVDCVVIIGKHKEQAEIMQLADLWIHGVENPYCLLPSLPPTGNEVYVFYLGNVFLDIHRGVFILRICPEAVQGLNKFSMS